MNNEMFSKDRLAENFRGYIIKNQNHFTKIQAMNSYYKVVVGSILDDQINKNSEIVRRIRNLEEAYQEVYMEE